MDAPEILLLLRSEDDEATDGARRAVEDLVAKTSPAEQAAVVTALRRGATWQQACDWLQQVQREATSMPDGVYERALGLFGGSTVLEWKECLDVAPALLYRLDELPLAH